MADDIKTKDHLEEDIPDLGALERAFNNGEAGGRLRELTGFAPVIRDTDNKRATRANYKLLPSPTTVKFGELKCLRLPNGLTLAQFKTQQEGLNRIFVCNGKAIVGGSIQEIIVFRPKP
jgi:hypothetical protein